MTVAPCKSACQMLAEKMRVDFASKTHQHQANYTQDETDALLDEKADDEHTHVEGSFIVGQIVMFAGSFLPSGFLWCNGLSFDAFVYADLYGVIGYTYGVDGGDPLTPNFQDAFPFGASITHPRGEEGGEDEHTLTSAEMPVHNHGIAHSTVTFGSAGSYEWVLGNDRKRLSSSEGGGGAHNNLPPYLAVQFMIFAGV